MASVDYPADPNPYATARDEKWMQHALALARLGAQQGEVPVGAVIVVGEQIVGQGYNQNITSRDPSAHAEIVALRAACAQLENHRIPGATLYVTLEPCCMCAGAIIQARVSHVVFAAEDPRAGACGSVFDLSCHAQLNHKFGIRSGICAATSRALLQTFFRTRR